MVATTRGNGRQYPSTRTNVATLVILPSDMGGVITAHLEHGFHRRGVDELLEAVRQAVCHRSRLPIDVDEPVVEGAGTALCLLAAR